MSHLFYFAWVNESERAFSISTHARQDEDIVTAVCSHKEGEFASLTIEVRNPRIGLLNPTRKQWAWLSWDNGTTIVPLFFGRLVGVPQIKGELATIEFLARPSNFVAQKAELAQTLKVAPYWDPVFISGSKRSNPDSVLETRTAAWHIDRTTNVVTVSDLLNGEDGTETFATDEVPYDSVEISMEQQPLISVTLNAHVGWSQQSRSDPGVGVGQSYAIHVRTYTGSSIVSGWPKENASLGNGWSCARSSISTDFDAEVASLSSGSVQGKPQDVSDEDPFGQFAAFPSDFGDDDPQQMTASLSWSNIGAPADWIAIITASKTKGGIDGASVDDSGFYVPAETINASIKFGYDISRQRQEHLSFTMSADVQAVQSPSSELDTEVIDVSGVDVGIPLDQIFSVSVGGTFHAGDILTLDVLLATGINFSYNYTVLISDTLATIATAFQTDINADLQLQALGIFADTPVGSNFGVHAPANLISSITGSSLGTTLLTVSGASLQITLAGSIHAGDTASVVVQIQGVAAPIIVLHTVQASDTLIGVANALVDTINNGSPATAHDHILQDGISIGSFSFFQYGISATTPEGTVSIDSVGTVNVKPVDAALDDLSILSVGSSTIQPIYSGNGVINDTFSEVVFFISHGVAAFGFGSGAPYAWISAQSSGEISATTLPGGGNSSEVPLNSLGARSYFPTDRGLQSIEYLLMLARAHLTLRSRAVGIAFQCRFERLINLSCRKNALINDNRLPGGQAAGKITEYGFTVDGDKGELIGTVKISCCVGHGTSVSASAGTPEYVDVGYVDVGYQFYLNQINLVGAGDVGYTVPIDEPADDGVTFPLNGPLFILPPTYRAARAPTITGTDSQDAVNAKFKQLHDTFTFMLQPLDTGPFTTLYGVTTTTLVLPKDIDLESAT